MSQAESEWGKRDTDPFHVAEDLAIKGRTRADGLGADAKPLKVALV